MSVKVEGLCKCIFAQYRQSQMQEMPGISNKCQNNGFSFCLGSLDVSFEISLKESDSLLSKVQYNMTGRVNNSSSSSRVTLLLITHQ